MRPVMPVEEPAERNVRNMIGKVVERVGEEAGTEEPRRVGRWLIFGERGDQRRIMGKA